MKMGLKFQSLDLLAKNLYFFNDSLFKVRKHSQHEQQMQMLSHFQKNLNSEPSSWEQASTFPQENPKIIDNEIYYRFKEKLSQSKLEFKEEYEAAVKTLSKKASIS